MNGKGDKLRKGANLKAYYDNYDKIFSKKTVEEWQKIYKDIIIDYDGFRHLSRTDKITATEYENGISKCTVQL